jgi:hypothetical protein
MGWRRSTEPWLWEHCEGLVQKNIVDIMSMNMRRPKKGQKKCCSGGKNGAC